MPIRTSVSNRNYVLFLLLFFILLSFCFCLNQTIISFVESFISHCRIIGISLYTTFLFFSFQNFSLVLVVLVICSKYKLIIVKFLFIVIIYLLCCCSVWNIQLKVSIKKLVIKTRDLPFPNVHCNWIKW